ncbi:MAG: hypothetical protein ACW98F_13820 [Candidatus Hodarchaeales archaeon]
MIELELGNQIYSWNGPSEILDEKYFQVKNLAKLHLLELKSDSELSGIVLLGKISIVVDSIVYTQTHGAIGETTEFIGSSLVILGLELTSLQQSVNMVTDDSIEAKNIKKEANQLIGKLRDNLTNKSTNIHFDKDSDISYIIFGKSDLFLLGSSDHIVLIHKKKISVRKGENSLVQVDPHDGITIVNEDKCFRIGSQRKGADLSILGELGVNIASKVLDAIVWD